MNNTISVGVDIGSQTIKVIVSESSSDKEKTKPRIVGVGYAESKGLRHGYILNIEELIPELKKAISLAEKSSGIKITKAHLGVSGIGVAGTIFSATQILPDRENEITREVIEKITAMCERDIPEQYMLNREVLHAVPLQYKIDNKVVLGKPIGMKGTKLEVKMLFITCIARHLEDLIEALNECGVSIQDVASGALAGSLSCLTKAQQVAGCVLLNIGAETVSATVFENGTPISLEIFQIGGNDITNDIALGLKIPLEDAERVKLARPETVSYPRKKLEEIISARLGDIFELVEAHLKKIGRSGLLPAGVIMTGSSASIPHIEELAKTYLKLPAKKACMKFDGETKCVIKDGSFSIAYGLTILGINSNRSSRRPKIFAGEINVKKIKGKFMDLLGVFKRFLP